MGVLIGSKFDRPQVRLHHAAMHLRDLKLQDISEDDSLRIYCKCGVVIEMIPAYRRVSMARHLHLTIAEYASRLRCSSCQARTGFKITLSLEAGRTDPRLEDERVVIDWPE